jgi:hypothetical protein
MFIPCGYSTKINLELLRLSAGYSGEMPISLDDIELNQLDLIQLEMQQQSLAHLAAKGVTRDFCSAVNRGGGADGFMEVRLADRKDFALYAGMLEATQARRRAWVAMAQAFIDKFGKERTPPDIIKCVAEVRAHWNINN